jgi:hypothetical protein
MTGAGEPYGHGADGLAIAAVDDGADDRTDCADPVTASEKRKVTVDDLLDQWQ